MTEQPHLRIGISLGDPSGIGPEITALALEKILSETSQRSQCLLPVIFGNSAVFARACRAVGVPDVLERHSLGTDILSLQRPALIETLPSASHPDLATFPFGIPTPESGSAQLKFLQVATQALTTGQIHGLCTAPVCKESIHRHQPNFQGHTEFLAEAFGIPPKNVLMLLAGPTLRVAIHTRHVAIQDVASQLSTEGIERDLHLLHAEISALCHRPGKIAVLSLNPHCGEGGLFGDEEHRIISPAIERGRQRGIDAEGPFAADGFFAREFRLHRYDAILAMYHDQGLIPLKMAHFDDGVNVTVGLPRPRTSPDHGVAYDLAGTGKASAKSMVAALNYLADRLSVS